MLPTEAAGWRAGAAPLQPACTAVPVDGTMVPCIQTFRRGQMSRAHWLLPLLSPGTQQASSLQVGRSLLVKILLLMSETSAAMAHLQGGCHNRCSKVVAQLLHDIAAEELARQVSCSW